MDNLNYIKNSVQPFFQFVSHLPYPTLIGTGIMAFAVSVVKNSTIQQKARFAYKALAVTTGTMALWSLSQNLRDYKACLSLLGLTLIELIKQYKEKRNKLPRYPSNNTINSSAQTALNPIDATHESQSSVLKVVIKNGEQVIQKVLVKKEDSLLSDDLLSQNSIEVDLENKDAIRAKDIEKFLQLFIKKSSFYNIDVLKHLLVAELLGQEIAFLEIIQNSSEAIEKIVVFLNQNENVLPRIQPKLLSIILKSFPRISEECKKFVLSKSDQIKCLKPYNSGLEDEEFFTLYLTLNELEFCDFSLDRLSLNISKALDLTDSLTKLKSMKFQIHPTQLLWFKSRNLDNLYLVFNFRDNAWCDSMINRLEGVSKTVKNLHCEFYYFTDYEWSTDYRLHKKYSPWSHFDKIKSIPLAGLTLNFSNFTIQDVEKVQELINTMKTLKTLTLNIPKTCYTDDVKSQLTQCVSSCTCDIKIVEKPWSLDKSIRKSSKI